MDDMARTLGSITAEVIIAFVLAQQKKKEQDYMTNKEMIEQEEKKMQEKTYKDIIQKLREDIEKYFSGVERDRLHDQLDTVEKKLQEEGELDAVFNRNHKYYPEITYEYAQRMEAFENKIFQQWLHEIITPESELEKEKKLDRDRDGLTDDQERRRGTDPTMIDTDRDGKPDPEEEQYGTDEQEQEMEMEG